MIYLIHEFHACFGFYIFLKYKNGDTIYHSPMNPLVKLKIFPLISLLHSFYNAPLSFLFTHRSLFLFCLFFHKESLCDSVKPFLQSTHWTVSCALSLAHSFSNHIILHFHFHQSYHRFSLNRVP